MPSLPLARLLMLITVAWSISAPSNAQLYEDFADGDFSRNPEWQGSTDRWQIVPFDGTSMLNSNGPEQADTLHLATSSDVAYGSWSLRFIHQDVNLSNFNGARIFLQADGPDLRSDTRGYFLQLGTNNTDQIRLYRMDEGDRRIELGRTDDAALDGSFNDLRLRVERSAHDVWSVYSGDRAVITATDSTYGTSSYFGLWVKHTASAPNAYFFDDIRIIEGDGPPRTAPGMEATVVSSSRIILVYDRPVARASACDPFNYDVSRLDVLAADCVDQELYVDRVQLRVSSAITPGTYRVTGRKVVDRAGAEFHSIEAEVNASPEDVEPFTLTQTSHSNRRPREIWVGLSRAHDPSSLDQSVFHFDPHLDVVKVESDAARNGIVLHLDHEPAPGAYVLTVSGLKGAEGDELQSSIKLVVYQKPSAGALVINEVHFDPPDQSQEFIELLNISDDVLDAADLDYTDDRGAFAPIVSGVTPVEPGRHLVLVRDSTAFAAAFPGVRSTQPHLWHTLNNGGDAVVIRHQNETVDSLAFTSSSTSNRASLERVDPGAPAIHANFGPSIDPNGATPGRQNSIHSTDRIPTIAIAAEESELDVIRVTFSAPIDPQSLGAANFLLDGRAVADASVDGDRAIVFAAGGVRPRKLRLAGIIDLYGDEVADVMLDVAALPRENDLIINEIMFDPLAKADDGIPDQPEYVELLNVSGRRLSVARLQIADTPDENGNPRAIAIEMPGRVSIEDGYTVIVAEPELADDYAVDGRLARAFPGANLAADEVTLLPVRRTSLSLPQGGRAVRVLRADGGLVTETHYRPQWHHPSLDRTMGFALERIDTSPDADDALNWTTSTSPSGGTPGTANSVSLPLVSVAEEYGITVAPPVFSPDRDGIDDIASISFRLEAPSASVRVRIFDSRGRQVRHLEPAAFVGREGTISWDGFDDDGRRLRIGIYIVFLDAIDAAHGITESYKATVVLARPLG